MKSSYIGLRLSEAQRARLEWLAQEAGANPSEIVRQLIDSAEIRRVVAPRSLIESGGHNGRVAA